MDLDDNETAMNSFDSQVETLRGTIESLEAQLAQNQTLMSDMEARLEDSKAQVEPLCYTKVYQNDFVPQISANWHNLLFLCRELNLNF